MKKILCFLSLFWLITVNGYSQSADISNTGPSPVLAFSDLINGPASGLGDGLGEGAIVTVWGYHLGEKQGQVFFTDSSGKTRPAAHIYYWKKADGQLPGGPANLYESHQLYEVAFSIPKSSTGDGDFFFITDKGLVTSKLKFKVNNGRIFHVKSSGNSNNIGSYNSPWQFINGDAAKKNAPGNSGLIAGDIVYSHGVEELHETGKAAMFLRALKGDKDAHISFISYPGTLAKVQSPSWGIHPYLSTAIVISKFTVEGGNMDDPKDDSPYVPPISPFTIQIKTTQFGRIIGNKVTDIAGKCSNGMSGAISGTGLDIEELKVFGNEITNIGCKQTSHFHHTTYLTRRSNKSTPDILAPELGWNYLHDNMARYGIHIYDETNSTTAPCDHVYGDLKIHNNVIIDQRGPGINVYTTGRGNACWKTDVYIYNNTLVNTGLGPISEIPNGTAPFGMKLGGSIAGKFYIKNNIIYKVSDESSRKYNKAAMISLTSHFENNTAEITENLFYSTIEMPLLNRYRLATLKNNTWGIESFPKLSTLKKIQIKHQNKDNTLLDKNISLNEAYDKLKKIKGDKTKTNTY